MPVTFRVDDVVQAPELPPTHTLAEHLGGVLALGGDGQKRVLKSTADCPAPLLGAIHVAFSEHRPLVLSPDAVWLTILSGVSLHVNLNAESLRPRLVRHQGKRELIVQLRESLEKNPAAIRDAVAGFRTLIAQEIGDGPAALLTCDFTTTTDVELAASEILLMDTYSPYFDYEVMCVCGIPEITLLGESKDWSNIRERIDVLAELDLEWWTSSLALIAEQLLAASEGHPNAKFFRDIYKPQEAYGWDLIAGWSARLYPYIKGKGRFDRRNPLLEVPLDWRPPKRQKQEPWYNGPGIHAKDVPAGLGSCVVKVDDAVTQRRYTLEVHGGLIGVEVDAEGRLAPCAGWTLRYATSSTSKLIESLRERADFVAQPKESVEAMECSTPERLALADAFGEARLFVGSNHEWRLRAPSQAARLDFPIPKSCYVTTACLLVDLPDGSGVCQIDLDGDRPWLVRLTRAQLELLPETAAGATKERIRFGGEARPALATAEVEVVADSLTELLAQALHSGGAIPTAVTTLAARRAEPRRV